MADERGPKTGRLIVVEGIDGSGKTTVAQRIVDTLAERGLEVHPTQEPTDGFVGTAVREAIRDPDHDPVSEALLFAADHAAHVAKLREVLRVGRTVVSDRYSTSWLAYQAVTLEDAFEDVDPVRWLDDLVAPFELEPDLVLLLDLPVEEALERVEGRRGDSEKFERTRFLKRVRGRYLELAQTRGFTRVDASASLDETVEACIEHVDELLGGGSA